MACSTCPVPVDGNWGRWGVWGQCSKTCGDGIHKRVRTCSNPAPKHAGKNCVGSSTEVKVCTIARCHLGESVNECISQLLTLFRLGERGV